MMPYVPKSFSTITAEELLQHIIDFYNEFKRPPTTADFENSSKTLHPLQTHVATSGRGPSF